MSNKFYIYTDSLSHHGIKGQKWGERRFQNPDGTLTPEGKERYRKYKNEFGETTANRLIKDINKGISEEKALKREYNRRVYGSNKYMIPLTVGSSLATIMTVGRINPIFMATAETVNTFINSTISKKLNQVTNKYSNYDVSDEGILEFYNKINNL